MKHVNGTTSWIDTCIIYLKVMHRYAKFVRKGNFKFLDNLCSSAKKVFFSYKFFYSNIKSGSMEIKGRRSNQFVSIFQSIWCIIIEYLVYFNFSHNTTFHVNIIILLLCTASSFFIYYILFVNSALIYIIFLHVFYIVLNDFNWLNTCSAWKTPITNTNTDRQKLFGNSWHCRYPIRSIHDFGVLSKLTQVDLNKTASSRFNRFKVQYKNIC